MVVGNTGLHCILQMVLLWGLGFGTIRSLEVLSRHMHECLELHRTFFMNRYWSTVNMFVYAFASANKKCMYVCLLPCVSTYVRGWAIVPLHQYSKFPFPDIQCVMHGKILHHFFSCPYHASAICFNNAYMPLLGNATEHCVEFSNSTNFLTWGHQSDWLYQNRINYLKTMEMNHTWIFYFSPFNSTPPPPPKLKVDGVTAKCVYNCIDASLFLWFWFSF